MTFGRISTALGERGAMEYQISVDIDAPPDVVWAVMSDGERWHEWTASVTSVRRLDKGPLRIGSRALIRQPRFPPAVWKVTALEPGRSFIWRSGMPLHVGLRRALGRAAGAPARARRCGSTYEGVLARLMGRLTRGITNRYLTWKRAG